MAAQKKAMAALGSPQSVCSNTTYETIDTDCSDIISIDSPDNRRKLTGSTYESFVLDRKDFRHWGTRTYTEYVECGARNDLLGVLSHYANSKNKEKGHEYIVSHDELPLNTSSTALLSKMETAVTYMLERITDGNIKEESKRIGEIVHYSDTWVRQWTLMFIHNRGMFCNVGYKQRDPVGLMHDAAAKQIMTTWMLNAIKGTAPATANDFASFVNAHFDITISQRTAQVWLRSLGFKFKMTTKQEIYNDGHERPDVLLALQEYIQIMKKLKDHCTEYSGKHYDFAVFYYKLI